MIPDDPEQRLEAEAEDLEHKGEHLEEDIEAARRKADRARNDDDAPPAASIIGDFEDTETGTAGGDDPVGAARERGDHREQR
jgi:hypothetical protein